MGQQKKLKTSVELATEGINLNTGKTLNIDFDGTCVSHEFPEIGNDIGAAKVLKELVEAGHKLILFTMRSDSLVGDFLSPAVKWFEDNSIPLYGVQTNPSQIHWTSSPKSYANYMIDDSAIGCPLITDLKVSSRPFVNWGRVRELLCEQGLLEE